MTAKKIPDGSELKFETFITPHEADEMGSRVCYFATQKIAATVAADILKNHRGELEGKILSSSLIGRMIRAEVVRALADECEVKVRKQLVNFGKRVRIRLDIKP